MRYLTFGLLLVLFTAGIGAAQQTENVFDVACEQKYIGITYDTGVLFEVVEFEGYNYFQIINSKESARRFKRQANTLQSFSHYESGGFAQTSNYPITPTKDGFLVDDSNQKQGEFALVKVKLGDIEITRKVFRLDIPVKSGILWEVDRLHTSHTPFRNGPFWTWPIQGSTLLLRINSENIDQQEVEVVPNSVYNGRVLSLEGASILTLKDTSIRGEMELEFNDQFAELIPNEQSGLYPLRRHPLTGTKGIYAALIRKGEAEHLEGSPYRFNREFILDRVFENLNKDHYTEINLSKKLFNFTYDGVSQTIPWWETVNPENHQIMVSSYDPAMQTTVQSLFDTGWTNIEFQSATANHDKVILKATRLERRRSIEQSYILLTRQNGNKNATFDTEILCN